MPLAQNGGNTRLGRNWGTGIVRGVRPLVFTQDTGFRDVDSNATWIPGQFVILDSTGRVTAITAPAVAQPVIGIAKTSKGAPFYLPYTQELEWAAANTVLQLDKSNVKDVRITSLDGLTVYAAPADYTVPNGGVNGTVVVVDDVTITAGTFVQVTYQYKDMDHTPFDQTIASGKTALFESNGEYAFEVYDTAAGYAVNAPVYVNTSGILTSTAVGAANGGAAVGFVTRVPSADDVTLGVKITVF